MILCRVFCGVDVEHYLVIAPESSLDSGDSRFGRAYFTLPGAPDEPKGDDLPSYYVIGEMFLLYVSASKVQVTSVVHAELSQAEVAELSLALRFQMPEWHPHTMPFLLRPDDKHSGTLKLTLLRIDYPPLPD